ncbi:helix-turn-helix domain-containing protein [Pediococcus pentosaceus]|uniref:helix-turn-helix domain-containing protein n=1 Tax=Pediococcus pentosaceus TaxID=1255 RepID=UPI001F5AA41B|nr:helix-turn-helix transcriptional regulator [Pediococcus pentosaceus]MCI2961049.1 helix-turn-helix transcriptional regulator [Pediococcus pentosaceus]
MVISQEQLGEELSRAMERQSIIAKELAFKLRLKSVSTISMWTRGERPITENRLRDLCDVLGDWRFKFIVAGYIAGVDFLGDNEYQNNVLAQHNRVIKEESERKEIDPIYYDAISRGATSDIIGKHSKESFEEIQAEISEWVAGREQIICR